MAQAKPFVKILFTKTQTTLGGDNSQSPQLYPPDDTIIFDLNRKFFPESTLFYFDIKLNIDDKSFPVASFLHPPLEPNFEIKFSDNSEADELMEYLADIAKKKNTPLILDNCFLHFAIGKK